MEGKLNCDALSEEISAGLTGSTEALITLQNYSKLWQNNQNAIPLCRPVGGYRLPREGDVILGEEALLAEAT